MFIRLFAAALGFLVFAGTAWTFLRASGSLVDEFVLVLGVPAGIWLLVRSVDQKK
ncbi:hypothetical protein AB0L63_32100 [Nocardia sp. NPDC051990]|uniref:hypothetical protein n=1 Tax=Nocardia sp. NPDC051990 TaxID=3155285 RepID=UPI00342004D3